jgi:hypothetical protein
MALKESAKSEQTQTTDYKPSPEQMEQFRRAQMGMAGVFWDQNGQFQTPYYQGPAGGAAGATPEMQDYFRRAGGMQAPGMGGLGDQMSWVVGATGNGWRNPNEFRYSGGYDRQNFQVNDLNFRDPFQGYTGGGSNAIQAPSTGLGSRDWSVPWERVSAERVSGPGQMPTIDRGGIREIRAPELQQYQMDQAERVAGPGAVERIGNAPQIVGPQLAEYQMAGPREVSAPDLERLRMGEVERVQAPGVRDLSMQAAGPVSAGQVATDSWVRPGNAAAYMDPYMQAVVDTQKRRAVQDYQQGLEGIRSDAARSGAFGGTRQAVAESTSRRDLQDRMAQLQAAGTQQAYQSGQGQFNTEQQLGLGAQQSNVQSAMQAALANQQAQQGANQANLQAGLTTQGLGAQSALQAALANQQTGLSREQAQLQADLQRQGLGANTYLQAALANQQAWQNSQGQNLQALLSQQALGAQLGQQGQLANQQMWMQGSQSNQQMELARQQLMQQANLANQQAGMQVGGQNLAALLQTQGLGAQLGMQGQMANQGMDWQTLAANQQSGIRGTELEQQAKLANQQAMLQAALANQQTGFQSGLAENQFGMQGGQFDAQMQMQAALANQQARENMFQRQYGMLGQQYQGGMQAGMQGQNLGMRAQELGMNQNQFASNFGLQQQQAQNRDMMAQSALNMQLRNQQMQGIGQQGNLMTQDWQNQLGGLNAYGQAAGMGQDIANRQAQGGYNQWLWEQNYPIQAMNQYSNLLASQPQQGSVTTSGTRTDFAQAPSFWSRLGGAAMMGAGAGMMAVPGGQKAGLNMIGGGGGLMGGMYG